LRNQSDLLAPRHGVGKLIEARFETGDLIRRVAVVGLEWQRPVCPDIHDVSCSVADFRFALLRSPDPARIGPPERHAAHSVAPLLLWPEIIASFPRQMRSSTMPTFKLPLSGDVFQAISPWTAFMSPIGSQMGLFNVRIGESSEPAV